jgi:hypothetical protein
MVTWKQIIVACLKGYDGSIQLLSNDTKLKELAAGTNYIVYLGLRNILYSWWLPDLLTRLNYYLELNYAEIRH